MPRYAPAMSIADLQTRLLDIAVKFDYAENYSTDPSELDYDCVISHLFEEELLNKVLADWEKIDFDGENESIDSFNLTPDGVPYFYIHRGGDWESAVACIIYYDGKTFRGFVPKDGNAYNHKTKTAFGNSTDDLDNKQAKKQCGEDEWYEVMSDDAKCKAEINSRIQAKGTATYDSKPVKSNAKIKAEKQAAIEKDMDLSGDITKDMVYVKISKAAGGAYFCFNLRASGRRLTTDEHNRVIDVPTIFRKDVVGSNTLWYSPQGMYPARTHTTLEAAGFEKDPENDISMFVGARTQYIFI